MMDFIFFWAWNKLILYRKVSDVHLMHFDMYIHGSYIALHQFQSANLYREKRLVVPFTFQICKFYISRVNGLQQT